MEAIIDTIMDRVRYETLVTMYHVQADPHYAVLLLARVATAVGVVTLFRIWWRSQ